MAERETDDVGGSFRNASASVTADRRRMTSSKRGHQHHPKFLGNRQPASAVDVITALRAATSTSSSAPGPGKTLLDRLNNNSHNQAAAAIDDNDPIQDPVRPSDTKPVVPVVDSDRGIRSSSDDANNNKSGKVSSLPNAQVEQKNVGNLLIESLQTTTNTVGNTHTTVAEDDAAPAEAITAAEKLIRSASGMDQEEEDDLQPNKNVLQRRATEAEAEASSTHCDTNVDQLLSSSGKAKERHPKTSNAVEPKDGAMDVATPDEVAGQGDDAEEDSAKKKSSSRRSSNSVLTERNTNKSVKRRSVASSGGLEEGNATGTGEQPKRKSPSKKASSGKDKEKKKSSSRASRSNKGGDAMDQSVSTDMTSSQESRSEDTENDPEAAEWAKLRCTSERTEVVAEREYRRQNRRCADYPGLAFGRSIFSSDTMMKFNIIRNELHNIMKTQLKRVRVEGRVEE